MTDRVDILSKMRDIDDHIIHILTAGTYTTFTKAIREAVSNSYDAGAKKVEIIFIPKDWFKKFVPDELIVQIHDDGSGMSDNEFCAQFASIATPTKNPKEKNPITKRYPIGQFGIGAFAFVPFVKEFTVYSKKYNKKPIKCRVKAGNIMKTSGKGYKYHISENIDAVYISEEDWKVVNSGRSDSGTVIKIEGVNEDVYHQLLKGSHDFKENKGEEFDIYTNLTEGLKEITWHLSSILPLPYEEDDIYTRNKRYLKSINDPIEVKLSGIILKRRIFGQEGCFVEPFRYDDHNVKVRGIVIANPSVTKPSMANGIMLRLNNVGIGTHQFFGFRYSNPPAQARITGEIHILKGLHDELKSDREGFKEYGDEFYRLNNEIQETLSRIADIAKDLKPPKKKKVEKEEKKKQKERRKELLHSQQKKEEKKKEKKKEEPIEEKTEEKPEVDTKREETKKEEPSEEENKKEEEGEIKDPVVDLKQSTGEMQIDPKHELFKLYKTKYGRKAIEDVLFALKVLNISEGLYLKIIDFLIALRKGNKK